MEKKENQRIMLTKQLLQAAFLKLLKTKPIPAISIRELCAEAGINRTTFYNHYGSQYDLLRDISQRFLDSISVKIDCADADTSEDVHRRLTTVLEYLLDNPELSVLLVNNNIDPSFAERIFSLPKISEMLDAALSECSDPRQRKAKISFAIHGSYKLLQEWINEEHRLCPAEEAALILTLARRVCS